MMAALITLGLLAFLCLIVFVSIKLSDALNSGFELDEPKKSITGYSCPECGACSCSEITLINKTESIFNEEPDPHYSWTETHKCQKCETIYTLENGI